ncbi:GNAT family N-acetyltransferase [Brytella acorum]|uniref:GNAT family N-acetyltransferase n=1 Tax=Brytella acorum TaxID=2959299 RepID=A0AA35UP09_9PROT|nr:GNAT family N-acetyltransferase [Brytella acorum]MDF3625631.1 GNAT family N-acetyltransferase [Brytella acorum]CAI9119496.1 GNAT family N-acetyltransferase [Brytella acorum]
MPEWSLTLHASIHEIDSALWNRCAGGDNPFVSHGFLSALEDSGSVGARTGWIPRHAVLRDQTGTIAAVAPLFGKGHSYGEYVFDQTWAQAYEQAGGRYYPKFQVAVPFSPVTGPRLLIDPAQPEPEILAHAMAEALAQACDELGLSSIHATFCTATDQQRLVEAGWLARYGLQYQWHNRDYRDFEDFLSALSSRKRKTLRRERRDAQACGLTFHTKQGHDITDADWRAFYRFYQSTVDRKWGNAYLTERFFPLLAARLGAQVVLMTAEHDGTPVAAALNIMGGGVLYGRNWGCEGQWPFLHFELCYYRAIEFAIAHGLSRVEAGAQGEHKIQRGYLPVLTRSTHHLRDPALRDAVANFLVSERDAIMAEKDALETLSPYRDA